MKLIIVEEGGRQAENSQSSSQQCKQLRWGEWRRNQIPATSMIEMQPHLHTSVECCRPSKESETSLPLNERTFIVERLHLRTDRSQNGPRRVGIRGSEWSKRSHLIGQYRLGKPSYKWRVWSIRLSRECWSYSINLIPSIRSALPFAKSLNQMRRRSLKFSRQSWRWRCALK